MTKSEKCAICRILFDLIQADSIIDSGEMEHYSVLREKYSINREDEVAAAKLLFRSCEHTCCVRFQSEGEFVAGLFEYDRKRWILCSIRSFVNDCS